MASENFRHVRLGDERFVVRVDSYKKATVSDFSPRVSAASGQQFSQMDLFQQLHQTGWAHGFGWQKFSDEQGYAETVGMVDTRHAGLAMLFTTPRTQKVTAERLNGFLRFHTWLFAWGPDGSFKSSNDGVTWVASGLSETMSVKAGGTAAITSVSTAWSNGIYLFACIDGGRIYYTDDLTTWTATGIDADAKSYRWITSHSGYVYAGKQYDEDIVFNGGHEWAGTVDRSNGVQVFFDGSDDLSDLHGDADGDPTSLQVGMRGGKTVSAIVFAGSLLVFRTDGLYQLNPGNDGFSRLLDYTDVIDDNNFQRVAIHNGYLIFSIENKLYQWNGSRVSDITPPRLNDSFPYETYGYFRHLIVFNNYLYCIGRTNETDYTESLLCYDGVSWFKLHDFAHKASETSGIGVSALWFDPLTCKLWFCIESLTDGPVFRWRYIQFQDKSVYPYGDFITGTDIEHALITSWIDSGYPLIRKASPTLAVDVENLTDDRYIEVYYRTNNNVAWLPWGGTAGVTNRLTSEGLRTLNNPRGNNKGRSVFVYRRIQFKFVLVTDDGTQSPILKGYSLRTLMRPETYYGWSFAITVEPDVQGGRSARSSLSPKQAIEYLELLRDSGAPITFADVFGDIYPVYITMLQEILVNVDSTRTANSPHIVQVNLVEVKNYNATAVHDLDRPIETTRPGIDPGGPWIPIEAIF